MHIQILTAMHKRHTMSWMWAIGITEFMKAAPDGITCSVHVAISEEESLDICKEYGFTFTRHPNSPLGKKINTALKDSLSQQWDYLLIMGDDDFISPLAWNDYLPLLQSNYPYFGYGNILFYSPQANRARVFDYGLSGAANKLIGCGRMVHRQVVEQCAWHMEIVFKKEYHHGGVSFHAGIKLAQPVYRAMYLVNLGVADKAGDPFFEFWNPSLHRGLDNDSEVRLLFNGHAPIRLMPDAPRMVDVKAENNIWPFAHYLGLSVAADVQPVLDILGPKCTEYMQANYPYTGDVGLPMHCFPIGIRSEKEIMDQELMKIVSDECIKKTGGFRQSSVTMLRFNDHPGYVEAHVDYNTPTAQRICGVYIEKEPYLLTFYVK
jgi:hypothetical protein